mgnify:CR=1 FL=1
MFKGKNISSLDKTVDLVEPAKDIALRNRLNFIDNYYDALKLNNDGLPRSEAVLKQMATTARNKKQK